MEGPCGPSAARIEIGIGKSDDTASAGSMSTMVRAIYLTVAGTGTGVLLAAAALMRVIRTAARRASTALP